MCLSIRSSSSTRSHDLLFLYAANCLVPFSIAFFILFFIVAVVVLHFDWMQIVQSNDSFPISSGEHGTNAYTREMTHKGRRATSTVIPTTASIAGCCVSFENAPSPLRVQHLAALFAANSPRPHNPPDLVLPHRRSRNPRRRLDPPDESTNRRLRMARSGRCPRRICRRSATTYSMP